MDIKIEEIKYKSLVHTITEKLEGLILRGALKPGERILETVVSQKFNVSRASVREALRVLETHGFVINKPRKGVYVAEITAQEAEETFIIRADLESLATFFAVKKQDPAVLDELKAIEARAKEAAFQKDMRTYWDLNQKFHEVLYNASGNTLLSHMTESFIKQTKRYRIAFQSTKNRLSRSLKSHDRLIDLFELNEPEKARKFRKKTLLQNAKTVAKKIKEISQGEVH